MLISVSPDEYVITRPSYRYTVRIPACKGVPYTEFLVTDQEDCKVIYQGLKTEEIERVPFPVPADVIVRDIFQSEQLESLGVFALPEGRTIPTEAELNTSKAKRRERLLSWALEGDRLHSQFGERGIQHIPDFCKRAVVELGESRAWVFSPSSGKTECPVCGEMLRNLSSGRPPAICKSCNSILDPERVAAHRPDLAEEEHRKPGRPKKETVAA